MEYISESFATSIKMWSIEQQKFSNKYLTADEAFKLLFTKQNFNVDNMKKHDEIDITDEIINWRSVPWLDDVLEMVLMDSMLTKECCDAEVEIINDNRQDGIKLGFIKNINVSADIYNINNLNMLDYYEDIDASKYYPKLCLISEKRLNKRHFHPYIERNSLSFDFYKKHRYSWIPSYHYYGEEYDDND